MGGKTREIIFPETHDYREKKRWKKIVLKSAKTRFFVNTRISWPKIGGKTREKILKKHKNRVSKKYWKKSSQKSAKKRFL